jgi:hypothetical protein
MRSFIVRAIGFALPIIGIRRMGRTLRVAGTAIAIWRVVHAWRSPG